MKKQRFTRDRGIAATLALVLFIAVGLVTTYITIAGILRERSIGRLEEGVDTVMDEVIGKFSRDSRILNATAQIIAAGDMDTESVIETMGSVAPLLDTMNVRLLMPDETVITADGRVTDVSDVDDVSYA